MAKVRAEQIAELLKGAGLEKQQYVVRHSSEPQLGGPEQRKVTVRVIPG